MAKYSSIKKITWMDYVASACKLMKKVEMNRPKMKTIRTMKTEVVGPCKKMLMIDMMPERRK